MARFDAQFSSISVAAIGGIFPWTENIRGKIKGFAADHNVRRIGGISLVELLPQLQDYLG